MDLQSFIDQRIEELESSEAHGGQQSPEERSSRRDRPMASSSPLVDDGGGRDLTEAPHGERVSARFDPHANVSDFCVMVDAALVEIAGRVMEIAERVTDDNARLEKELMDSRLAALENAESVMDMALGIRKKAHNMMADRRRPVSAGEEPGKRGFSAYCEVKDPARAEKPKDRNEETGTRANMHASGVADLFRGTR